LPEQLRRRQNQLVTSREEAGLNLRLTMATNHWAEITDQSGKLTLECAQYLTRNSRIYRVRK